jgi:hypothetical protein
MDLTFKEEEMSNKKNFFQKTGFFKPVFSGLVLIFVISGCATNNSTRGNKEAELRVDLPDGARLISAGAVIDSNTSAPNDVRKILSETTLYNKPNRVYLASNGTAFSIPDGRRKVVKTHWRIRKDSYLCIEEAPGQEMCINVSLNNSILSTRTVIELDGTAFKWYVLQGDALKLAF